MAAATVSSKGWVVIPAEIRRRLNIRAGDTVHIFDYGGVITIVPALEDPIEDAMGMFTSDTSLTKALLEERARDKEREERKAAHVRAR